MRISEVLQLIPSDIEDGKLTLRGSRNGKDHEIVFIPQKFADRLVVYITSRGQLGRVLWYPLAKFPGSRIEGIGLCSVSFFWLPVDTHGQSPWNSALRVIRDTALTLIIIDHLFQVRDVVNQMTGQWGLVRFTDCALHRSQRHNRLFLPHTYNNVVCGRQRTVRGSQSQSVAPHF
jgi:hypothetical protein